MKQVGDNKRLQEKLEALCFDGDNIQVNRENEINKNKLTANQNNMWLRIEMVATALISAINVVSTLFCSPLPEIILPLMFNEDSEAKLRRSVTTIKALLDSTHMKAITDDTSVVKADLQNLEDVAFEADNLLDEINYCALRYKVEKDNKLKNTMDDFLSAPLFEHKVALMIEQISDTCNSIEKQKIRLRNLMRHNVYVGETRTTTKNTTFVADNVDLGFVGRENDVREIVDMLTSSTSIKEQVISILPIVGMGGVGKTALAKKVYHHECITSHFGKRIWVHVSENFNQEIIMWNILSNRKNFSAHSNPRAVMVKLREKLKGEKYFLVLDNVWIEDPWMWDKFIASLEAVSYGKGNIIIVTTRNQSAYYSSCSNIQRPLHDYKLGGLSDEDCWFIIKRNANFQVEQGIEAIGKRIAKKCGGLPLAAEVYGCMLYHRSQEAWLSIERLLDLEGNDYISEILKLSYDNLPSPTHKKCFVYSAIIPKGSSVEKEELIELWMAEGLLQADTPNDMEIIGHNVLNVLIQCSMLQVHERDFYGDAKKLGMHDLMNDLAFSISRSNNQKVRYISPRYFQDDEYPRIEFKKYKFVRTFLLKDNFSDNMLPIFECLHTLILVGKDIKQLPVLIGNLMHLKYLDIALTRIESLPESICKLYLFQTLRATTEHGGISYLRRLPVALKYMISLRHLHIPNIELPREVGKLKCLQTLPYFHVSDEEGHRIVELKNLTNLRGELEITNLGKVRDKEEAKSADLFNKKNISMLRLVWEDIGEISRSRVEDESVLEGLQPHPNLKRLEIDGFSGISFPLWTMHMAVREDQKLNKLIELRLSNCRECEKVPMLGQLPHLKYLYLTNLINVKSIGSSFYGNDTMVVFPKLQRLELIGLEKLTVWEEVNMCQSSSSSSSPPPSLVFPCLEVLVVKNCRLLQSAPSHFPCLKSYDIDVESSLSLESIWGSKLTSRTNLTI